MGHKKFPTLMAAKFRHFLAKNNSWTGFHTDTLSVLLFPLMADIFASTTLGTDKLDRPKESGWKRDE